MISDGEFPTSSVGIKLQKFLKTRPATFEADLVRTLHNYSVWLSGAGRNEEAAKAAEESLAMYRSLHKARPAELAGTLNNYSILLIEAGQREDALKAMEESLRMWRALQKARPAAFGKDLATIIANYSDILDGAGRHEEARKARQERSSVQ
ncbi:hypothetical protein A4X03_0g9540 [Tilletia caries]|uniref:Tetratricopeptide repeat protein n=3 Tax=Tilletia TaxID=13289 RepID=A0A8T8SAL9_9BASI|nr:hypothetical protein CF335_g9401 [Tilletia laevis]KAE8236146.1 hypothetical protein A4X03_0g9540 [Tilletia caries]